MSTEGPADEGIAFKRVTFQTVPPLGTTAFLTFAHPETRVALLEEKRGAEWPTSHLVAEPDFNCICIDSNRVGSDVVQRAEEWIHPKSALNNTSSVVVKMAGGMNTWVRVKSGQAVVCLPENEWNDALTALADFVFHETELRRLEGEIAAEWSRAEKDLPLANDVTPEDLNRLGDIGAMTRSVWMRRIRLSKLERPLTKCQFPLAPSARKLAVRLRAAFDIHDRAETLDGQIEVYEYIYEMANQRMGEYGNFRKEYLLEILIIFLLAAELCVMIADFLRNNHVF